MNGLNIGERINFEELLDELDLQINPQSNLPIFKNSSNSFLCEILDETSTGIFIYGIDLEMIVWGNNHFYQMNQIKPEHIVHPSFSKLIARKLHLDDLVRLNDLKVKLDTYELDDIISSIIRLKQKDATYKYFLIHILSPKKYRSIGKVKIGMQFDLTKIIGLYDQMNNLKANMPDESNDEEFQKLSKRERQILKLIVTGNTDKEIARVLDISFYTVETHRKNIIQKLQVKNTAYLSFLTGKCGIF